MAKGLAEEGLLAKRSAEEKPTDKTCSVSAFVSEEKGNISVTTAVMMVLLVFFMGLSADVSMILLDHGRLDDLCQVVEESRYAHQDAVRFADNPAAATVSYVSETLTENGFKGSAVVNFEEAPRSTGHRHIQVDITLSCDSPFYFLSLFGRDSVSISSTTTFEDDYGEGGDDVVWAPAASVGTYNDSYMLVF